MALLLVVGVAAVGLGPFGGRRSEERFPCEECLCGCSSAIECWTDCCCHTPLERAKWALANGVLVPSWDRRTRDAVEALRARVAEATVAGETVPTQTELPACCRSRAAEQAASVANSHETCKRRPKLIAGWVVLLCLDSTRSELRFVHPLVAVVLATDDRRSSLPRPRPPVPPPRR